MLSPTALVSIVVVALCVLVRGVAGVSDPAQVFVQGEAIVPGRPRANVISPDSVTGILNVTLNMSAAEIAAVEPAKPFVFVLYKTQDYAEDNLQGAQHFCSYVSIYSDDQMCAGQIANNRVYETYTITDILSITLRNMTLPNSSDAYRLVTFAYNFKQLTFSIVDPPGSAMQAYSSDIENYNAVVVYSFAPKFDVSVPVFWTAYTDAKTRRNAKLTVFRMDPSANTTRYIFRTTAVDLSAMSASPSTSAYNNSQFVFPCAGAGNETWGADCATCDSDRFDNTTAATGLPKICGKCKTGRYGGFCQYTDATRCQVGDCNGYGSCSPASRECICMQPAFANYNSGALYGNPVVYRFGAHCELDQHACSLSKCGAIAVCDPITQGPPPFPGYPGSPTANFTNPTCTCGSVSDWSYVKNTGKTFDSQCMNCTTGYLPGETCTQCAPGYYGSTCSYTDPAVCAANNAFRYNCKGNGTCLYVKTPGTEPPCNCTTANTGLFNCDTNPCSSGNIVSFQDAPDMPLRWYCNASVSWCTDDYRYQGLDASKSCYVCTENFTYVQHTSGAGYGKESCIGCKQGRYGPFCNLTSEADCRASVCGGHGTCGEFLNAGLQYPDFQCICDKGFSGANCTVDAAVHNTQYCSGHGNATVHYDSYGVYKSVTCWCDDGHYGTDCSLNNTACVASFCQSTVHTTCGNVVLSNQVCTCDTGYYGSDCASPDGNDTFCNGNGAFNIYWNSTWSCTCDAGYFGATCLFDAVQCRAEFCTGNGECSQGSEASGLHDFAVFNAVKISPNCTCDPGFSGRFCELSTGPFALVDPASVNITVTTLGYDTLAVNESVLNTSLTDFGSSVGVATNFTASGVVAAAYNSGVYFTYTAINVTVQQTPPTLLQQQVSSSGLGTVFKRHFVGARVEVQTSGSLYTISVMCAQGAVVGSFASGLNLTIDTGDVICVDDGTSPGCVNQTSAGYINGSIFTVLDVASGTEKPCPAITILDVASGKTVTVVNVVPDTVAMVARLPYSPAAPMSNFTVGTRDCTTTLLAFLSPAADRYYVVGRNCTSGLDPATSTSLFIDVFSVNTTATETDSADLTYVTTQLLENPYSPYSSDRVLWAPHSQRLLVRHPATGWNLIPLNPDTGLFETGFLVAQTLPGKTFDPWMDVVLYDSGDTLAFVTFGTFAGLTTAFPIVVNVTRFSSGFVGSSIRYLHQSISGFQPTVLSDHYSTTQIHISFPEEIISLVVVGGRVLLAVEKIVDLIEPFAPPQYVGLMCLLPNGTTIRSANSQLCTDFNTQLDTGFLLSANAGGLLVANPYLDDIQSIVVMPYTESSTKLPMIVVFVRASAISTFSISVSETTSVISSKLVQEIDAQAVDSSITNCTFGQFNSNGTLFVLVCERVIAYFNVDQRSFFMTFETKHSTPTVTSKVCVSSLTGRVYAINNNITQASVFTPFLVQVPREAVANGSTSSAATSSSSLLTVWQIALIVVCSVVIVAALTAVYLHRRGSYAPVSGTDSRPEGQAEDASNCVACARVFDMCCFLCRS